MYFLQRNIIFLQKKIDRVKLLCYIRKRRSKKGTKAVGQVV